MFVILRYGGKQESEEYERHDVVPRVISRLELPLELLVAGHYDC